MCLSHVPLPSPVAGICCKEVSEIDKYIVKDLVIPKAQIHCEVHYNYVYSVCSMVWCSVE